jgi:hypothetical protein
LKGIWRKGTLVARRTHTRLLAETSKPVRRTRTNRPSGTTPITALPRAKDVCLEVEDHSLARRSAVDFFQLRRSGSDPQMMASRAARLAEQFVTQNRSLMALLDVRIDREYDGTDLHLLIQGGSAVGAIPLISPTTARHDYGLVVQPRFPWAGIGRCWRRWGGGSAHHHCDYHFSTAPNVEFQFGCCHS